LSNSKAISENRLILSFSPGIFNSSWIFVTFGTEDMALHTGTWVMFCSIYSYMQSDQWDCKLKKSTHKNKKLPALAAKIEKMMRWDLKALMKTSPSHK